MFFAFCRTFFVNKNCKTYQIKENLKGNSCDSCPFEGIEMALHDLVLCAIFAKKIYGPLRNSKKKSFGRNIS